MNPKKLLIISYYWPPSGGSGVQRWVKFAKYLREYGWEPVIYTPENPEPPAIDHSLEKDLPEGLKVLKRPILEPYSLYKKLMGMKKDDMLGAGLMKNEAGSSLIQKLSVWIRGNFFIPDARKFWIRPSVRYLSSYIKKHEIDALVTTGPPHSMHMIGLGLKQRTDIPWLADFRDPWTNIDFFEELSLTKWARRKHHRLERKVLKSADSITVVSPTMKKEFEELLDGKEVKVITNGFDTDDFAGTDTQPPDNKFILTHIGMMTPTRNPEILWQVLKELSEDEPGFSESFRLHLIGKTDVTIRQKIIEYGLTEMVELIDYVPHDEIIDKQQASTALLLIINESPNAELLLPGKLFEYLASGRPILCLSPVVGDVNYILRKTGAGELINTYDKFQLKQSLKTLFRNWNEGEVEHNTESILEFSREQLTKKMAHELNTLIS